MICLVINIWCIVDNVSICQFVAQWININIITVMQVHVITTMVLVNFVKFCFRFVSVFLFVFAWLFFLSAKKDCQKWNFWKIRFIFSQIDKGKHYRQCIIYWLLEIDKNHCSDHVYLHDSYYVNVNSLCYIHIVGGICDVSS
jgi:hypothetical protein